MGFGYDWMKEGRDVVRIFYPSSNKWETLPGVKLSEYRWYPTQVSVKFAVNHVCEVCRELPFVFCIGRHDSCMKQFGCLMTG